MIKVTASPTWQLTSPGRSLGSKGRLPIAINAGSMTIKQTLLPRSLDVSFEFKYRR